MGTYVRDPDHRVAKLRLGRQVVSSPTCVSARRDRKVFDHGRRGLLGDRQAGSREPLELWGIVRRTRSRYLRLSVAARDEAVVAAIGEL